MSPTVEDMLCDRVLDRMEAFIDDDVTADESAAIKRHLDHCDACAEELEHALETLAALRALPELDVPDRVIEDARAAIRRQGPAGNNNQRANMRRRWLAAAAAIVIGIIGTTAVVRDRTEPTDPEALRAAAEVQFALATIGEISERANRMVQTKVIDHGPIPQSFRGLARSLGPLTLLQTNDGPPAAPYEPTHEGNS
jgi:anti-sigma factor RsiW